MNKFFAIFTNIFSHKWLLFWPIVGIFFAFYASTLENNSGYVFLFAILSSIFTGIFINFYTDMFGTSNTVLKADYIELEKTLRFQILEREKDLGELSRSVGDKCFSVVNKLLNTYKTRQLTLEEEDIIAELASIIKKCEPQYTVDMSTLESRFKRIKAEEKEKIIVMGDSKKVYDVPVVKTWNNLLSYLGSEYVNNDTGSGDFPLYSDK
ncbi:MAG: hypothetical protein EPGJADBJ_00409 [Saprospiraceae bacterium]|nr:hypothetical protein [Saprospiraceae bacterium]